MKRVLLGLAVLTFALFASGSALAVDDASVEGKCVTCHKEKSPGIYRQWYESAHSRHNGTCLGCHQADRQDADAFEHEGAYIATLVTPIDCGRCHEKEAEEVGRSHHAKAGQILDEIDHHLLEAIDIFCGVDEDSELI